MQKELLTIATICSMAIALILFIVGIADNNYMFLIASRNVWWVAFAFAVLNVVFVFADNWQYSILKWRTKKRLNAYPLWVSNGRAYEREVKQAFLINAEKLGVDRERAEADFGRLKK